MAKKLTELKSHLKKVQAKYNQLRQAVEDAETKLSLPKLKKQYEGKFWKYNNSCGGEDKWWYYSYCKKVVNTREAICDTFQTTLYENEFKNDSKEYFHLFETEITRQEYMNALTQFFSKCQLLRDNVVNDF